MSAWPRTCAPPTARGRGGWGASCVRTSVETASESVIGPGSYFRVKTHSYSRHMTPCANSNRGNRYSTCLNVMICLNRVFYHVNFGFLNHICL